MWNLRIGGVMKADGARQPPRWQETKAPDLPGEIRILLRRQQLVVDLGRWQCGRQSVLDLDELGLRGQQSVGSQHSRRGGGVFANRSILRRREKGVERLGELPPQTQQAGIVIDEAGQRHGRLRFTRVVQAKHHTRVHCRAAK